VGIASVFMGTLNVRHIFFIPASASSMFNIASVAIGVAVGYAIDPHFGPNAIIGWAIATLAGGFVQMACQVPSLMKEGWHYRLEFTGHDTGLRDVFQRVIPGIIAGSAVQINVLISTYFAS